MALDTYNEHIGIMNMGTPWYVALPLGEGDEISQDDQQLLLNLSADPLAGEAILYPRAHWRDLSAAERRQRRHRRG